MFKLCFLTVLIFFPKFFLLSLNLFVISKHISEVVYLVIVLKTGTWSFKAITLNQTFFVDFLKTCFPLWTAYNNASLENTSTKLTLIQNKKRKNRTRLNHTRTVGKLVKKHFLISFTAANLLLTCTMKGHLTSAKGQSAHLSGSAIGC